MGVSGWFRSEKMLVGAVPTGAVCGAGEMVEVVPPVFGALDTVSRSGSGDPAHAASTKHATIMLAAWARAKRETPIS